MTWDETGGLFFPITGNSGLVEMMVVGRLRSDPQLIKRITEIESLVGLMRGLRPTLAQVLERFASRRAKQFGERLAHRASLSDAGTVIGQLREADCAALAIFERSNENLGAWIVTRFEQAGRWESSISVIPSRELIDVSDYNALTP